MRHTHRRLTVAFALLLAMVGGLATSASAVTATVPNYFQCNVARQCWQQNGTFVRGYPVYCHRVIWLGGPANRSIGLCQKWV